MDPSDRSGRDSENANLGDRPEFDSASPDLTDRSWRRVRAALDRLEAEYGEFEVVEKAWDQPPETYEWTRERFERGTLGGAGTWVRNDDGEVLLVREADETGWSEPAGKHEPGETLAETARRETREETGVECAITGVRRVQRVEHRDATDPDRPAVVRVIVTFDAERRGGTVRPREGEIDAVRWWAERPDDLLYGDLAELPLPVESD